MSEPYECIACGREWQDHPGTEATCKLAYDLATTLRQVLNYTSPPPDIRDFEAQELYFDLLEKSRKLIVKSRNFSAS